jgi:hypothetical protein
MVLSHVMSCTFPSKSFHLAMTTSHLLEVLGVGIKNVPFNTFKIAIDQQISPVVCQSMLFSQLLTWAKKIISPLQQLTNRYLQWSANQCCFHSY